MLSRTARTALIPIAIVAVAMSGLSGCANTSKTGKGAAAGAGIGAVVGGMIGASQDATAKGAIIGAAVGGTAGAIIGRQMDKQAKELEESLEGAEVERVGEGIQVTFDSAILFDFNSSTLKGDAKANLEKLAASLKDYANTNVMVVGHTDATGSDEYNLKLSQRRAESAADWLVANEISPTRITTIGKGEMEPVATNETSEGRAQNRRVEIAITATDEYREQLEAETDQG